MDTELTTLYINVNYLVSKLRKLERDNEIITKKYNRHIKEKEEEWDQYIEMKERNFKNEERIKELESTNHFNAAQTYQKELVKAEKRIKELEERVGRIDELTNEVYGEGPDYPARFTLNNVVYFEDETGCYMIADHYPTDEGTILTVSITHQEYIDSLNQYLKQEDPRDYPEDPSYE